MTTAGRRDKWDGADSRTSLNTDLYFPVLISRPNAQIELPQPVAINLYELVGEASDL
jgi:hypothetical protein